MIGFSLKNSVAVMLTIASFVGFASSASASLLTPAYEAQLATWLGQGSLAFTNIYSGSTGDAHFNSYDWHDAVDGRGATITLMKVPPGQYNSYDQVSFFGEAIIGGYNPRSWSSLDVYNFSPTDAERTAFIFNLSANILLRQGLNVNSNAQGIFQTYNVGQYGPTFGGGHDFVTNSDFSSSVVWPYSYGKYFGPGLFGTITPNTGLNQGYVSGFPIVQLETFTIAPGQSVFEPSTVALIAMALLSLFGIGLMRKRAEG